MLFSLLPSPLYGWMAFRPRPWSYFTLRVLKIFWPERRFVHKTFWPKKHHHHGVHRSPHEDPDDPRDDGHPGESISVLFFGVLSPFFIESLNLHPPFTAFAQVGGFTYEPRGVVQLPKVLQSEIVRLAWNRFCVLEFCSGQVGAVSTFWLVGRKDALSQVGEPIQD